MAESMEGLQEWEMVEYPPEDDVVEYPTRMARFSQVRSVALFFPGNFGDSETTHIDYIGFKGEWEELKQEAVVTVFELNANPADHPKTKSGDWASRSVM
jgi:PITH domain